MPGFGSGPFGNQPFGEYHWSRRTLFDYIPEIYRQQDAALDGLLETFAEALRPSFDDLRKKISELDSLREPLTVRTQYDEIVTLKLGPKVVPMGELEQRGIDGRVDAIQQFISARSRFSVLDIGKELTLYGSAFEANNKTVVITSVINTTTVLTEPALVTDVGPLTWELRPKVEVPDGTVTVQVRGGDVAAVAPGWILSDGFTNFTVSARRQFPSIEDSPSFLTEREGVDGTINGSGHLLSATANFTQRDVGKLVSISTSVIPENNNRWEIQSIVSASQAVLENQSGDPPAEDGVAFFWALLPVQELDLLGQVEPRGTVEQEGYGGSVTVGGPPAQFKITNGEFTANDVGKLVTIRGSATPSNNTTLEIVAVLTKDTVTLDGTLTVDAGPLAWEVRKATVYGDALISVEVRAPSLIRRLAKDFGIEIDTQENEDRQRSWVGNVSQWISRKGTPKGYEIIGNISGFDVDVFQLFRITPAIAATMPAGMWMEVGEPGSDRSGTDGTLSNAPHVIFSSPTAGFLGTDVGNHIRIQGAADNDNNKLYTIQTVIDDNTVQMLGGETIDLPEANNGSLTWSIVRLYATQAPTLPLFDDFDADFMEQLIDGDLPQSTDLFGLDKWCWEEDHFSDVEIVISSATQTSPGVFLVTVADGPAQGPSLIVGHAGVILHVGHWYLVDSDDVTFAVETIPVPSGPDYTFEVRSALAPVAGVGILRYTCPVVLTCDYCAASRVALKLTADSIGSESGVAIESLLERVLRRMEMVTPAHVTIVPQYVQSAEISLSIGVTVTTP